MSWLKIDDGFAENSKVDALSDRAFRLHVAALCYCARNLTDGALAPKAVKVVCAIVRASKKHVQELIEVSLWIPANDGEYTIKDFNEYNPPASKVKEQRAKARERMQGLRTGSSRERSREQTGERSDERSGEQNANVRGPRPVPSPKDSLKAVTSYEGTAEDRNIEDITPDLREIA